MVLCYLGIKGHHNYVSKCGDAYETRNRNAGKGSTITDLFYAYTKYWYSSDKLLCHHDS